MAFPAKLFSFLFLVALFSSSLFSFIHARESQFFNKNTRGNEFDDDVEENEPLDDDDDEPQPRFQPRTQRTFGGGFDQSRFRPDATNFNNLYQNNKAADVVNPNQRTQFNNNDINNRFNPTSTNNLGNGGAQKYNNNQFDANRFATRQNGLGFTGQQQQKPQQQPQQQPQVKRHGMSDTRFVMNGAFFYNINKNVDAQRNSVNKINRAMAFSANKLNGGLSDNGIDARFGNKAAKPDDDDDDVDDDDEP